MIQEKRTKSRKKVINGGRNLLILGVGATLIACVTTGISLAIYHNSGDIYLDRSRPGFLPDEAEIDEDEPEEDYGLTNTGKLTVDVLDEYLQQFDLEIQAIDAYEKPFEEKVLSDEYLGIIGNNDATEAEQEVKE
jgi:hypothetical protein